MGNHPVEAFTWESLGCVLHSGSRFFMWAKFQIGQD